MSDKWLSTEPTVKWLQDALTAERATVADLTRRLEAALGEKAAIVETARVAVECLAEERAGMAALVGELEAEFASWHGDAPEHKFCSGPCVHDDCRVVQIARRLLATHTGTTP